MKNMCMNHPLFCEKPHLVIGFYGYGRCKIAGVRCTGPLLCRTMACFERDLHTLISGEDHVVLALYRRDL